MNASFLLAWAMLAVVAGALVVLPFLPCWREWRHPTDLAPLAIGRGEANDVHYFADAFRAQVDRAGDGGAGAMQTCPDTVYAGGDVLLPKGARLSGLLCSGDASFGPDTSIGAWAHADGTLSLGKGGIVLERATAGDKLLLGKGAGFCRMHAPVIQFGSGRKRAALPLARTRTRHLSPARAGLDLRACGAGCYRAAGDVRLPGKHYIEGTLIAGGGLRLDDGAAIFGAVKAHGNVRLGRGVQIHGALVCEGDIEIGPDCWIKGPVVCESDVRVGHGSRIGTRQVPTTVLASRVLAEAGVTAHGTVWARDAGVVSA